MSDKKTTSTTKDRSGFVDILSGTKTYETTISNGAKSVTGTGVSPASSQQKASNSWGKKNS